MTLFVSPEMELTRLDKLLTLHYPGYSRAYFQTLIDTGCVLLNGKPVKKKEIPRPGDEIEVCFQLTPEITLEPENIPLSILFEDEHLLVIDKPVGMVVHPAPGNPCHTFVNALLYHCKHLPSSDTLRPGIVHRLDKNTSGLLLAAKTSEAHRKLIDLFATRRIEKKYLAICFQNPGIQEISAPLARHPKHRQEMHVDSLGKEAFSRITAVEPFGPLFLVHVQILTGRTHQVRAHLKYVKAPILGDPVYGSATLNDKWGVHTQLLHAHRLTFHHPFTHQLLQLEAPIPERFRAILGVNSSS